MKITFLYNGDSSNINEWSNVPYFITETFKEYGHDINRVNMHIRYIGILYDFFVTSFIRRFISPNTSYNFLRSRLRSYLIDRKLKKVVNKYPDTDIFFCISDNFNPCKYSKAKCIMLCDWTYEFEIVHDKRKSIDKWENYYCEKQKQMMENAYSNIVMRDECRNFIKENYRNIHLYDKHIDVVNCVLKNVDGTAIMNKKKTSNKIVFIGAKRYIGGAIALVKCVRDNLEQFINKEVYFIGIEKEDIDSELLRDIADRCIFCGYLNKAKKEDRECYYDLLLEAKLCINTNEGFVSLAGLMEACYLYNPIIVSKHYQTVSCYGKQISCGFYADNTAQEIMEKIVAIYEMEESEYYSLCSKSHEYFADKTWNTVVNEWVQSDFGKHI